MNRAVIKYKVYLNIDGSRIKCRIYYKETYTTVAKWNSIQIINNWETTHLDYVYK